MWTDPVPPGEPVFFRGADLVHVRWLTRAKPASGAEPPEPARALARPRGELCETIRAIVRRALRAIAAPEEHPLARGDGIGAHGADWISSWAEPLIVVVPLTR